MSTTNTTRPGGFAWREFPARVGQLLTAPTAGLRRIEAEGGGLRDAVALVVLGVATFRFPELCRAILALAGPTSGVFFRLLGLFVDEAKGAAWVVLPAAVIVTASAGRRREASRDLDLGAACYAPFFALQGLARLIDAVAGLPIVPGHIAEGAAGLAAVLVLVPAVRIARGRSPAAASGFPAEAPVGEPAAPMPDARAGWAGTAVILMSVVAFGANALWSVRHVDALEPMHRGQLAPEFELPKIDGAGAITLGALRGQVVVLDFWATWCPPCVAMIPVLDEVHHEWAAKGVAFVGVNSDGGGATLAEIKAFLAEHHFAYPVVVDDGSVGALYKVEALPSLIVIGRDGRLRGSFVGYTTKGTLDRALTDAVN